MSRSYRITKAAILIAGLLLLSAISRSYVAAANLLHYQGRLTAGGDTPVPDGSYNVNFALYADSLSGAVLWEETATIETNNGLFSHALGSAAALPAGLFVEQDTLFMEITVEDEVVAPRSRLVGVPYTLSAAGLGVRRENGALAMRTTPDGHALALYDTSGNVTAQLHGDDAGELVLTDPSGPLTIEMRANLTGDDAVVLPESAISTDEMYNEPGLASTTYSAGVTLVTGVMNDLVTLDIAIPTAGYIVVQGKCYLRLSGTTGPNTALVQIDENEGGGSQFPYYQEAGLGGYVNTDVNFFPVFVSRVYYRQAGVHTFRMEGRANHPPPAVAVSWDHVLAATFFPTSYEEVKAVVSDPAGFDNPMPITFDPRTASERPGEYYEVDLRELERKAKKE